MSRGRVIIVTASIMLSLFMASMEATVVATAMPTIVSQLGGLETYSWVFSIYMLTSTTTVPIYGKLSDLYGRRRIFIIAMALFLIGSLLCGRAATMQQLIFYRGVQGLGAGGVMPMAFVIIGDLFSFEQRARVQGLFASVWGVSSVVGPLLGGFLVDRVSWHWVFYVNLLPGFLAAVLFSVAWRETVSARDEHAPPVDYLGAVVLTVGVVVLLLGLLELGTLMSWLLLTAALVCFVALVWIERRAADPILPFHLFRDRLFAAACAHGLFTGWALFGSASFVPLFVQAVLGTSATRAGATLTPQIVGWTTASIIGSRMLLRVGYRTLALVGMVLLTVGLFVLSRSNENTSQLILMASLALTGTGMGASVPAFLIAVQSAVRRRDLGTATSTVQFSRSIGGALGVSVMGVVLSVRLAANLIALGLDPGAVSVDSLIEPVGSAVGSMMEGELRIALAGAIRSVFTIGFLAALLGFVATSLAPRGQIAQLESGRIEVEQTGEPMPTRVGGR